MQEEKEKDGQAGETKPDIWVEFSEPEIREVGVDLEWSESMEQWAFYLLCLSRLFPNVGADWARIKDPVKQWVIKQPEPNSFLAKDELPWDAGRQDHLALVSTQITKSDSGRAIGGIFLELRSLAQPWDKKSLINL